ncbi:MAG TPA: DUF4382 domain-containing protein [Gammaproteobacteria bacterium]|nr:DUF4382 domain-containing protein [Gammaproteobacteria bacterium]
MSNTNPICTLLLAAAACLAGCHDADDTGLFSLSVSDAPVDNATAVVVEFTGVEIKPQDGTSLTFTFETPRQIDLLALHGGGSATLLDGVEVPAGAYEWIRLDVNAQQSVIDSYIMLEDGSQHSLWIPSGAETGLKLVQGFVVPVGGSADFTIDFDLRKSVLNPAGLGGDYILRPALRLVDNAQVGAIAGTVATSLIDSACTPAVYVFSGADSVPDDVDGDSGDPLTSARVELNTGTGEYEYRAAFLAPATYTVSFTCDAEQDDPALDDVLSFSGTQNATVVADQTTTVNFQ